VKILCPEPDSFSIQGIEFADKISQLTIQKISQIQFEEIAHNFDAILIRFNTVVNRKVLFKGSRLKAIISPTTGLNHIDMSLAKKMNVKVFHLKGEKKFLKGVSGTAELTIGLMISLMRHIPRSFSEVKNGSWEPGPYRGNEVSGKVLGIIGCGRLGSKVAKVSVALGMEVISYDPYIKRFPAGVESKETLKQVLELSDILSLHVPLSDENIHLISEKEISSMKDGVVIINTARGEVIDTESLLSGLKSRKISSVAIDVMENEHSMQGRRHVLVDYARSNDNLLITPHIGGATYESVEKTDLFVLKKFFNHFQIEGQCD
jgi:D-3-phosphoglycerate dehydrogenase